MWISDLRYSLAVVYKIYKFCSVGVKLGTHTLMSYGVPVAKWFQHEDQLIVRYPVLEIKLFNQNLHV